MSRLFATVRASTTLEEASEIMAATAAQHLVVSDGGRRVGILSRHDVRAWSSRAGATIIEAMRPEVYEVSATTPLCEVALEMARRDVESALVVDGPKPIGIFTARDALLVLGLWATIRPELKDVATV